MPDSRKKNNEIPDGVLEQWQGLWTSSNPQDQVRALLAAILLKLKSVIRTG